MAENYEEIRELYTQLYFEHDKPFPFKGNLMVYPVLVPNYYQFYSLIDVFTMNKNEDMSGKGISMSHLDYLFYKMNEADGKETFTRKVISLFELIFQFKNGIRCEHCDSDDTYMSYSDIYAELEKMEKSGKQMTQEEFVTKFTEIRKCPICGEYREDLIQSVPDGNKKVLKIKGTTITADDYGLLRKLVCYQNMLDFEDEYIDPELKAELEEAAKLRNPNSVTPSLEKQEACIIASTGYTYESIQKLSLRHLAMLLRVVDAKMHYMAYQQGEMSGLVKFEHEYPHWIYSNDKRSKYDTIQTLDSLKNKLSNVAKG